MSLEEVLKENTKALIVVAEHLARLHILPAAEEPKAQKNVATASQPEEPASGTLQNSDSSAEEPAPKLTYNDVKAATLKLSQQKGREAAVDVLSRFGVKGAQNLAETQWADYVAAVEEMLAGVEP